MTILEYINDLNKEYKTGRATEHSYRGYLQNLIKTISTDVMVTNEPTRVKCGAPDYIITKKDIPVGYIEAKDIGYKLDDKQYKEQFDRYRKSLSNLIITDYIDFWLYIDGELVKKIRIAEITGGGIQPISENHNEFTNLIKDFCTHIGQTIKSSKKLAEMMAGKARMLSEVIEKALTEDEADIHNPDTALQGQLHAFKDILIHDIKPKEFADIYAQTIAYGMFAARLHDPTLPTFSRQEAAQLIPKTNPFLRKLFQYVAGYDLDQRLVWIVDGLADIFRATDVAAILKNFGKSTQTNDPIIHFYETFLSEYDPALRKARGVWYTPEPVVNFIVRAVDDILKTEFDLKDGLADTSKTKIKTKVVTKATSDLRSKMKEVEIEQEVHRVQILDPATGTGTFLAEVVKHIYKKFEGQQGIWSKYVDEHLVPRLNGFELLMASYAMAHLKLDMLLTETGYKQSKEQRFKIYLTNSLEEHHPDTGTLFANWLSSEANEANQIKRDTPVMVVIGNPPYAVSSTNKGEWIQNLIADYKKDLKEKKINLDDDYIKFIRYGQHFIDKNGSGVLAYISANSFIDGVTHRQMRKSLLESFDKIYILDLHGNAKKKEVCPDGTTDQNVFDIMQGVSINIFVKTGEKRKSDYGQLFHFDLQGKRDFKYDFLIENSIKSIAFRELAPESQYNFFVPKNFENSTQYDKGFKLDILFSILNNGFQTDRDSLFIDIDKKTLSKRIEKLFSKEYDNTFISEFNIADSSSYKLTSVISKNSFDYNHITKNLYRPFDIRYIYYDPKVISRPANKVFQHFRKDNIGLIISRQQSTFDFQHIFLTDIITERCSISLQTKETGYAFPLYLYPETSGQQTIESKAERTPNLNPEIVKQIASKLGLTFTSEKENAKGTFAPIDILDYIYAVLHSPAYREKYKEFLKIDFPRVPYPTDANKFWQLVKVGGELRQIHLLESDTVNRFITQYPIDGDNRVTKIRFEENYELINGNTVTNADPVYPFGRVYINDTQFFQQVPKAAWEFYIGGYQPAQKWLKDRKDRELSFEDILHYQKIIVALNETIRLMAEVDKIGVE
jgi:predicted helicase